MSPGDSIVRACPHCGTLVLEVTLGSGNFMGARGWTDGKVLAPMHPDLPLVTRCRDCGRFFWVARAEEARRLRFYPEPDYDIVLEDAGPRESEVRALLRELRHDGWRTVAEVGPDARLPRVVLRELEEEATRRAVARLQERGATVSLRRNAPQTVFLMDAVLEDAGPRRIEVMALLRELRGGGLQEVKALLTQLPLTLVHQENLQTVRDLARRFEAVGARMALREHRPPSLPAPVVDMHWDRLPNTLSHRLTEADLLAALAQGVPKGKDEERLLRLRAWWAGNDAFREGAPWVPFSERSEAARDNLTALVELCVLEFPRLRLFRAEALRELERFDEAEALLTGVSLPGREQVVERFRELVARRTPVIKELPTELMVELHASPPPEEAAD